jgi:hypothetical protein
MAEVKFYAGEGYEINNAAGSGLGFFGANGFGYAIQAGTWNQTTFITNENGTTEGAEVDNLKWVSATGVVYGSEGTHRRLTEIPNDKATLNIQFTHTSAVDVQNAELRAYDGTNVDNAPSGMEIRGFEIIHPDITYTNTGSGDVYWTAMSGSVGILSLSNSPGPSGIYASSGHEAPATEHSWFNGLALSPSTIGSKTGKMCFSMEYL